MTETDTSRERIEPLLYLGCADYLHMALLARAEKAEAKCDTAWNDAIEAAAECVGHITRSEDRDAIRALRKGDPT